MQAPVERQVSAAYNSIPSLDSARIALIKKNGEMAPIMQTGRIVSMCFHSFCWDHEEVLLNMSRCIVGVIEYVPMYPFEYSCFHML